MKKTILIAIFFVGCSSDSSEKNIPAFNQKMAFQHLLDQCSYGPRNPGSEGHQEFSKYLEEYLSSLSKSVIIQEFSYTEHLTTKKRKGKKRKKNL